MKTYSEIGFYGKLPMVGDFVSRHLPLEFVKPWDYWLQASLSASQEQLDNNTWLNRYLTSPVWRFVLSPGLCGQHAWAGIMMPSVDNVGRYFPFTVAVPFADSPYLAHLFTLGENWFHRLELIALKGLEGGMDMASFEQLIQSIKPFSLPPMATNSLMPVEEVFPGLSDYLSRYHSGYSLWTTSDGEETSEKKLLVYSKLPPVRSFSGFLSGNSMSVAMYSEALFLAHASESTVPPSAKQTVVPENWQSWAISDIGKRRKHNEDAVLNKPKVGLWAVADGMGGHAAGDVASQLVIDSLAKIVPANSLELTLVAVQQCLEEVNAQLRAWAKQMSENHVIGSTVVVLVAEHQQGAFLWAGDSRLYRLRARRLEQLTQDHCPHYQEDTLNYWPTKHKNEITHAVGGWDVLEFDQGKTDLCRGDIFLLCSDGLYKELSFEEIEKIMLTEQPENIAQVLLASALQREGRDNISIVIVTITG